MRTLVLGGARSGKSTRAEAIAATAGTVDYVATSRVAPDDPEWVARIALHRARRPGHWRTLETGDVAAVLDASGDALVLVDCVGVWLTRAMDDCGCWSPDETTASEALQRLQDEETRLVEAVARTRRDVVLVSNEVGLGVVPAHPSGRQFRDQLGIVNMRLAEVCDRVEFCVAGVPVTVKG